MPFFLAYDKDAVNNDGHDTPILGYVEKMYVLDETAEDYIGSEENYKDYTTHTFDVISSYAAKTGVAAVDIAAPASAPAAEETPVAEERSAQNAAPAENRVEVQAEAVSQADDVAAAETENSDNGNVTKIIVAVAGVVIAGVVIFAVVKKKNSSGGGHCC